MTVEYIRYRIPADQAAEFEAAYARAAEHLASARQCVDYELTRCEEDPEYYVLRITWSSTTEHMRDFRGSEAFRAFFAEIRPYVEAIEEMRHYRPTGVAGRGAAVPSLYEWAGGADAFDRLCTAFYRKVVVDPELAPVFAGMSPSHPAHVAAWLGEVFGGPPAYSRERGGHAHMVGRHLGRAITEQQRQRWVALLLDTADEVRLPDDPEFRASFVGYLEWGTRIAVAMSAPGVEQPPDEAMPRWDWAQPPFTATA